MVLAKSELRRACGNAIPIQIRYLDDTTGDPPVHQLARVNRSKRTGAGKPRHATRSREGNGKRPSARERRLVMSSERRQEWQVPDNAQVDGPWNTCPWHGMPLWWTSIAMSSDRGETHNPLIRS